MKILHFEIPYQTQWGEHLEIYYSIDGAPAEKTALLTTNGSNWHTDLDAADNAQHIRYAYLVCNDKGQTVRIEANSWRIFYFNYRRHVLFCDAWADQSLDTMFQRSAFSQCIMLPRGGDSLHLEHLSAPCLLMLHALPPTDGLQWAVVGSTRTWGEWDVRRARPLKRSGTYEWSLTLDRHDFELGVEYKYLLINPLNPDRVVWESGGNRCILPTAVPATASVVRQDEMPRIDLPRWKGTGCVIPVFSLRSKGSFGIGDFGDLRLFVRWASETGLQAVQLLPINDTTRGGTWHDSYPYNGISAFALHPIYLDPREWKGLPLFRKFKEQGEALNKLPELDYEGTFKLKMAFCQELFKELGNQTLGSTEFKRFSADNNRWLTPYAQFCALRDYYNTADFRSWPHQPAKADSNLPDLSQQENFYRFVQFLLHRQMETAHNEARKLGVLLKGDIPIGICRDSVAAWIDGHLLHFNGQAGAPPDDFAVNGQNWGFPTYNWEEMAKDGYSWWRDRLHHMERYFDAYRIDHVLGFFRIWEVPSQHVHGVLGHFRPALPYTAEEIHNFGFEGNPEQFCVPFISENYLKVLQQELGADFGTLYLTKQTNGGYTLKPEFCTQREVMQRIDEGIVRHTLLQLIAEVLFVADPDKPQCYHPRIVAQRTRRFSELNYHDRDAFNRLHNTFFYERHNEFWADEALKKLPAITQSPDSANPQPALFPIEGGGMLACAEDLGMVPASVKGVLERLHILSLEIQRMPKEYGLRFGKLEHNPYLSVATIATHDMPPFRMWWKENQEQTQAFWNEALEQKGEAPEEATPEICENIVSRHILSPSMLCLLSLQDLLAISPTLRNPHPEQEQINNPANPNQYWRYRMHLTIEDLIRSTAFNEKLRGLIARH